MALDRTSPARLERAPCGTSKPPALCAGHDGADRARYLAHVERARREADRATDPDIKGLWRGIADGWAKLLQEKAAENIQRERRAR